MSFDSNKSLALDPSERQTLEDSLALVADPQGVEILAGLTREESEEFMALSRWAAARAMEVHMFQRYEALALKHHEARVARILSFRPLHH